MKKYAYLAQLEELLSALPAQEREDALNYYEEYFDAAGKENEEQTAAALGSPAEVAQKILEGEKLTAEKPTPDGANAKQPKARRLRLVLAAALVVALAVCLGALLMSSLSSDSDSETEAVASSETETPEPTALDTADETEAIATPETAAPAIETITDTDSQYTSVESEIGEIRMDVKNASVQIVQGTGDEFSACIDGKNAGDYTQAISCSENGLPTYSVTGGQEDGESANIVLTFPKSGCSAANVNITITGGGASIRCPLVADRFAAQCGSIFVRDLTARQVSLKASTGAVTVWSLSASDISLESTEGRVSVGLAGSKDDYFITASSATNKVTVDDVECGMSLTSGTESAYPLTAKANGKCALRFDGE